MAHLTHTIENGLAVIVLDNPPENRLSSQMFSELSSALSVIGSSEARALLMRAEGENFSLGGDIVPWPEMSSRELRSLLETYMVCVNQFERLSIPTVAAVQGRCFGGGFELALRADVIFAGETARFAHIEQSLGLATVLGGVYRVAERAGRSKAIEWALTSEHIPSHVMERYGVVNSVVPDDRLVAEANAFATKLASGPTRAHAAHKVLLRIWATGGVAAADEAIADIASPLFDTEDVKLALPASVQAIKAKQPRPAFLFKGR